ncbi:hypothetical protein SLS54_002089 [Diplodia seriata]
MAWTAADLVDLATKGGPLRCYRWHSDGDGREGKERSKRQLTEDAAKLGWCGRWLVRNYRDLTTTTTTASEDMRAAGGEEGKKTPREGEVIVDEETGLCGVTVRVPTKALPNQLRDTTTTTTAVVPQDGGGTTTDNNPNDQTRTSPSPHHTLLTIPPTTFLLIKLLTILYPSGAPWSSPTTTNDQQPSPQAAPPPAAQAPPPPPPPKPISPEKAAHNRRVWLAMSLGWAWALQSYLAAHPPSQPPPTMMTTTTNASSVADNHGKVAGDDVHDDVLDATAEAYLLDGEVDGLLLDDVDVDDDDDDVDDQEEEEWEAMSEVGIEDEDVLAALARVGLGEVPRSASGQRRASLVPSDGTDEDEVRERIEAELQR